MDQSRRRFLERMGHWLALGGLGVLVACQGGQQTQAPTSPPAPGGSPAAGASPTLAPAPVAKPAASPSIAAGPAPSPAVAVAASPSPARPGATVLGKPMYQVDAQHTGRSPYAGPRRPALLRTFDTNTPDLLPAGSPIRRPDFQSSSAIAADGTIYIANFAGWLFALRDSPSARDSLDVVWRFRRPGFSSLHATPAIGGDGTVYLGFSGGDPTAGTLYAFRAPAGGGTDPQVAWSVDIGPGRTTSSPTIGPDGTIYMMGGSGRLFAVAPNGTVKWSAMAGPTLKGSPALANDGTVYVPSTDGKLYAVAPPSAAGDEGMVRWSFDFGEHLGPTPLVTAQPPPGTPGGGGASGIGSGASPTIGPDGTIYIGANNSNLYAIAPTGQQKWLFEAERELAGIWATPALSPDNQTLYFGANKGGLYAVSAQAGSKKWQFRVYGSIYASSALDTRGTLYTGTTIERVYAVDSSNGEQVWEFDAKDQVWTAPSIRPDGTLVIANRSGLIQVIGDGG
jgi:outer membrane protein assembly factor BamB